MAKVPLIYEIVVESHLASHRFRRFAALAVTHCPNGETRLVGAMPDPAALYGLLIWLYDMGAVLVSVRRLGETDGGGFGG